MSICKSCGKEYESKAKFCPYCGAQADQREQAETISQSESAQIPLKWHFEKNTRIGRVPIRHTETDITIVDDRIRIIVTGDKKTQNVDVAKSVFELQSIEKKNAFDKWNFMLASILILLAIASICMGVLPAGAVFILAAILVFKGCHYINYHFVWTDGTITTVKIKSRNESDVEAMVGEINRLKE